MFDFKGGFKVIDINRIYASMEMALLNRIYKEDIISEKTYLELREDIFSTYNIEKIES